jgi:hypothetical protein
LTRESVSGRRRQGRPCCKMATPRQKAFCILQFVKTNSVTTVQRLFRTRFGIDHVPPLPNDLQELRQRIIDAVATIHRDMPERVWTEMDCRIDVCRVTRGYHIECLVIYQNFESFPNYWCVLRDCRLTSYFIINMWKCYLLFELPCTCQSSYTCFIFYPSNARCGLYKPRGPSLSYIILSVVHFPLLCPNCFRELFVFKHLQFSQFKKKLLNCCFIHLDLNFRNRMPLCRRKISN